MTINVPFKLRLLTEMDRVLSAGWNAALNKEFKEEFIFYDYYIT